MILALLGGISVGGYHQKWCLVYQLDIHTPMQIGIKVSQLSLASNGTLTRKRMEDGNAHALHQH